MIITSSKIRMHASQMIDFASSGITYLFDRGFFTIQVLDRIQSRQRREISSRRANNSRDVSGKRIPDVLTLGFRIS